MAYYSCYNTVWSDNLICGKLHLRPVISAEGGRAGEALEIGPGDTPGKEGGKMWGKRKRMRLIWGARFASFHHHYNSQSFTHHPPLPFPSLAANSLSHMSRNSCVMTDVCALCALYCTEWVGGGGSSGGEKKKRVLSV